MIADIECPYCEMWQDINHDDGYGYEEDIKHQQECQFCNKTFVFETFISYHYEAVKADCLNDVEHNYELTNTNPKEFSKMECTMCGEKRELSAQERTEFDIGTAADYFKNLNN